jgi:signal transduction histidine kinase
VRVLVATTVLVMLARMLVPGGTDVDAAIDNPAGVPGLEWLNWVVAAGATVTNVGGLGAAAVALSVRARRAVGAERRQLQWFFVAGLLMLASLVLTVLTRQDVLFDLALLGPPLGVVAGRLVGARVDVDTVLRRGVVLVVVLVVVGAGGTAVLLRLDPALTSTRAGVLVVGGLAVGAALVRNTVQRLLDRWWYPHRQEVATLEARVVGSTGLSADPLEALAELVAGVRGALRLPYVGFRGAKDVRDGVPTSTVVQLDALALGEVRGVLEASPRSDRGLRREERLVLERVAGQAGLLAHAAALADQVGRSRIELVAAREEERRRLRNDLHDGVGPSLAAVALQADALGSRLVGPPREAAWALRDDLRRAVGEVRVVSHGLRPPVLDQIGLRAALEQLVTRSRASEVRLELGALRGVGAAVEVTVLALVEAAVERADADGASELTVRVGHRDRSGGADLHVEVLHGPDPSDRPLDPAVHDAVVAVGGALADDAGRAAADLPGGTTVPPPTAADERISP